MGRQVCQQVGYVGEREILQSLTQCREVSFADEFFDVFQRYGCDHRILRR